MQEKALQLVSLAQAQKLKELGFEWEVDTNYNYWNTDGKIGYTNRDFSNTNCEEDYISAPTISLALKWFRDVKGIPCSVNMVLRGNEYKYITLFATQITDDNSCYDTYGEAESKLLDALLEYCGEKE